MVYLLACVLEKIIDSISTQEGALIRALLRPV